MKRMLFVLYGVIMLAGCGSKPARQVDSAYVPTTSALVVYSTRVDDKCGAAMSSLRLNYRYTSPTQTEPGHGFIFLQNALLSSDFEGRDGFYKIEEWPAGDYVFTDPTFANMKMGKASFNGRYDVRVKIEAGKAYYLGEFKADIPSCHVLKLGTYDEYERDRKIFDSKMKNVKSSTLIRGKLPTGHWAVKKNGL